jgi:hypothetical protein
MKSFSVIDATRKMVFDIIPLMPKNGHTSLAIGQDLSSIQDYIDTVERRRPPMADRRSSGVVRCVHVVLSGKNQ